jgi:hypothetical protein
MTNLNSRQHNRVPSAPAWRQVTAGSDLLAVTYLHSAGAQTINPGITRAALGKGGRDKSKLLSVKRLQQRGFMKSICHFSALMLFLAQ